MPERKEWVGITTSAMLGEQTGVKEGWQPSGGGAELDPEEVVEDSPIGMFTKEQLEDIKQARKDGKVQES